jgi:hypothetical protein
MDDKSISLKRRIKSLRLVGKALMIYLIDSRFVDHPKSRKKKKKKRDEKSNKLGT